MKKDLEPVDQIERDIDHEHRVGHFSAPSERYPEHAGEVCGGCGQFVSRGVITDSDIERLKSGFNSALLSRLIKRIDHDAAKIAELEASEPAIDATFPTFEETDLDVVEESALAMAQATIYNAMSERGLKPASLAKNMKRHRAYVSRILSGSHNLTVKTFARALAASGFELRLSYHPCPRIVEIPTEKR